MDSGHGRAAIYRRTWVQWSLLALLGGGCAAEEGNQDQGSGSTGEPAAGEWRRICDGSDELRLAFRAAGGGGWCARGCLFFELGPTFLYVRGDCQYWVSESFEGVWTGRARTGRLSAEDEDALSRALNFDAWPELAHERAGATVEGGSTFSDGTSSIQFAPGVSSDPVELIEADEAIGGWLKRLWDDGEAMGRGTQPRRTTPWSAPENSLSEHRNWQRRPKGHPKNCLRRSTVGSSATTSDSTEPRAGVRRSELDQPVDAPPQPRCSTLLPAP